MPASSPASPLADLAPRVAGPQWRWYLALAAPFILVQIVLLITGKTLPVFWGDLDENDHWALTQWLAERLPGFDPIYPHSATAPLFQLLGAVAVRLFHPPLLWMRTLNTLFSAAGVCALFGILRGELKHGVATSALLTTVYLTSCYFFGYSFRWLTDNLALTFCILALGQLLRFASPSTPGRLASFLWGCLWLSLTVLTRQNYLFLGLPFFVTLILSGSPRRDLAVGTTGLALAVLPFAALVFAWHGLVPPAYQVRHASSGLHFYTLALPLMLLGFYAPFFVGVAWLSSGWFTRRRTVCALLAAAVALVVVAVYPLVPINGQSDRLTYFPLAAREDVPGYFAGWLYAVGLHLPSLHGNSVWFWLLLPMGSAALACFVMDTVAARKAPQRLVVVLFLLGLLLSSLLNPISAQKYYDSALLLFLVWYTRGEAASDQRQRWLLAVLIVIFCSYFAAFTVVNRAPAAPNPSVAPAEADPA